MEKVSLDDVIIENNPLGVHSHRKHLSKVLGTEDFGMVYFELEPGDSFSGGMHRHHDQEEIFFILEGTATFETLEETREVDAPGCIRIPPGTYQQGNNECDDLVRALAFGAPGSQHDWDQLESLVYCQECEEKTDHSTTLTEDGQFEIECKECGASPWG
jgi:uncharacterized cupin superfamily protein